MRTRDSGQKSDSKKSNSCGLLTANRSEVNKTIHECIGNITEL